MKNYTFHVSGTHCASCKILIEDILKKEDCIKNAQVDLKKEIIHINTNSNNSQEELAEILTDKIKTHGYTLSLEKIIKKEETDNTIWKAIPIGIMFLILFFLLQKSGILNFGIGGKITPITSFIIGLIASVSSCLAIVGGLVLSLSAKVIQDDNKSTKKPFILFHLGRIFGFALLGGILGFIGKTIGINFIFSAILGLLTSIVMIFLGLNLLGILRKNKFTLSSNLFAYFRKVEHTTIAPILVGIGTFFLPCGFTQSMQVAALSSGSFVSGMGLMFTFALGTLPVLALLSFSSVSFAHSNYAPLFFKSAGIVVIGLGIFSFLSLLAGIGIINPLFNI
ncbi:MAG: sulfite exporter TauE/SafE family protein [Burkholderiales bacterium]|nr:sulfite exporter TauE/SafE family protein [Burkholderiales bacterium]